MLFEKHLIEDGEYWFMRNFLSIDQAMEQESLLLNSIEWKQEEVYVFGKKHKEPRKTAWYGYEGFNYSYSGINCLPEIWTKELLEIKFQIEKFITGEDFTSVLLNLYNDGIHPMLFLQKHFLE